MDKVFIVIDLAPHQYSKTVDLATRVYVSMSGSVPYPTPTLPLLTLQANNTALTTAITNWGTRKNRGTTNDLIVLKAACALVQSNLKQLKAYCESVTPNDAFSFTSAGWSINAPISPIGALGEVQNLRVIRGKANLRGQIKYRWNKMKGANSYMAWAGATPIPTLPPNAAAITKVVTRAEYIDYAPSGTSRYIIIGCVGADGETGYSSIAETIVP